MYIQGFEKGYGETPSIYQPLSSGMADFEHINTISPVGDPIFVHVFKAGQAVEGASGLRYVVIEPLMDATVDAKYRRILELILREAPKEPSHETQEQFMETLLALYKRVHRVEGEKKERQP